MLSRVTERKIDLVIHVFLSDILDISECKSFVEESTKPYKLKSQTGFLKTWNEGCV